MRTETVPMSQINVTPLVDVMLVLLMIFLLATPRLTHRMTLTVPQRAPSVSSVPEIVQIGVASDTSVVIDGQPVPLSRLRGEALNWSRRQPRPQVEVQVADAVQYQSVIDVLSTLRGAGMTQVRFADGGY